MTLADIFEQLSESTNISLQKADVWLVLQKISGQDMGWLIENLETEEYNHKMFESVMNELNLGKPLAYILNQKAFYGYDYFVDERVLIPRPETEIIVDYAIDFANRNPRAMVADICTGSGVIGITIANQTRNMVDVFDISPDAIEVAKINAKDLNIGFYIGDYLKPLMDNELKYDLITVNPPYIDVNDLDLDLRVKQYEPNIALFAENNGLHFYEEMFKNYKKIIRDEDNFEIIMEFGWKQKDVIDKLASKFVEHTYEFIKDYSDNYRGIIIKNN